MSNVIFCRMALTITALRFLSQGSNEIVCPAEIVIRDIVHYTKCKVKFHIFDIYLLLI